MRDTDCGASFRTGCNNYRCAGGSASASRVCFERIESVLQIAARFRRALKEKAGDLVHVVVDVENGCACAASASTASAVASPVVAVTLPASMTASVLSRCRERSNARNLSFPLLKCSWRYCIVLTIVLNLGVSTGNGVPVLLY